MSLPNNEQPPLPDFFAVKNLGFLPDLPVATEASYVRDNALPKMYIGRKQIPIFNIKPDTVSAVRGLESVDTGTPLLIEFSQKEVQFFEHAASWKKYINLALKRQMDQYGFKGTLRTKLKCLRFFLPGARVESMNPFLEHRKGAFANLLIDLPFGYKDGIIRVTRGSRTASFDFAAAAAKGTYSFLHWFCDSRVSIEPISSGLRAILFYGVFLDATAPSPLVLIHKSNQLRYLEAQLGALVTNMNFRTLHRRTCYLPLMRLLLQTYKAAKVKPVPACIELCIRVCDSYMKRVGGAIDSVAGRDVLLILAEESEEIVSSFDKYKGWKDMRRLLGPKYVKEFLTTQTNLTDALNRTLPR